MQIKQIHIDGFGIWHRQTWSGLTRGVNVFHGANEAGKTTLMSFIRSVLFGFERRTHPGRYEPQNGGRYGGWLEVNVSHQVNVDLEVSQTVPPLRIERKASRHVRGRVKVRHLAEPDDAAIVNNGNSDNKANEENDEARLDALLGGTTRTLYHNVFAFGLDELQHFRTLQDNEVASHIAGAGMGVGAARWSRVWKDIEDRRSRLFLPRGQNAALNQALKELAAVEEQLSQVESQPEDFVRTHEERARLEIEIRGLSIETERQRKRIEHYKRMQAAEPHRQRRAAIQDELGQLETIGVTGAFPDGGVERLNLLLHQRRQLEAELDRQSLENQQFREERLRLVASYTPQALIRTGRAVESLRSLLPRRDAIESVIVSAEARRDELLAERDNALDRRAAKRPPSRTAVIAFLAVVLLGATGLYLAEYPIGALALALPLAAFVYWYYSRRQSWRSMLSDVESVEERLEASEANLAKVVNEGRGIASAIERLVGRSDFTYVDLEREAEKARLLNGTADRIRSIDEVLAGETRHRDRTRAEIRANEEAVEELFRQGGATSESEFFRRSELFARRQRLQAELAQIPVAEIETDSELAEGDLPDLDIYPQVVADWERLESRLTEARTEAGRLDERIAALARSEERSRRRLQRESVLARVDLAAEEWAVLTLCRTLLEDTRRVYETQRQPEVLEHASAFFSSMTDGAWSRVISSLDSSEIQVESAGGGRLSPEHLSRGTAEQLYLAMRLALVKEYSRHVKPLPVILDDVFVNFDPDRMRRAVRAVGELAETHQILMFTCHPHLVEMVEEIVPGARIYPLQ